MRKIIFEELIDVYKRKNYKIFDNGIPYNLNIGGIRTNDMNSNKFNDWIYCFYTNESGEQKFHHWPATTDPGFYYLRYPLYKKGIVILAHDQYLGCWRLGLHNGKYKTLCPNRECKSLQRCKQR